MESSVSITHQCISNPREICRLPVLYQIEIDPVLHTPIVCCAIDIPREFIPEWLCPAPLQVHTFKENGSNMKLYNTAKVLTNDAIAFFSKVFQVVMGEEKERMKRSNQAAGANLFYAA
ncbi:MAG: hypothetical protein JST06_08020 [Bacteroidetes bacterium]|nr:hypothetical protein [Bacteroidota bacterium]MBS1630719.1 hypothetical protein [Bacteroidota bacterium]